jgi:Flp pilus assembly protein TadD
MVAMVVAVGNWKSPVPLEPLPEIDLTMVDAEVLQELESAQRNVEKDQKSAVAWGKLGGQLRAHQFGPESEVCFRNAQRIDPKDYRWPYLLGVSLAAADPSEARVRLRQAADLADDRLHVQLRLAESLLDHNELEEAATVVERSLRLAPEEPRALLAKARLLFAQGQLESSRDWCQQAAAAAPDKRSPHLLLTQLYRRLGDTERAASEMQILASIPEGTTEWDDPDVAEIIVLRRDHGWQLRSAEQLLAEGRTDVAIGLLSELARGSDLSGEATVRYVRTLLGQNQPDEAAQMLREKLAADPDSERLHFFLGIVLAVQEDFQGAATEFRRVTELKPDNVDAYYNLGHALRKAGDSAGACDAFATAVRLSPGHAFARANLAELLLEANRIAEARQHLHIAAQLAPRDPKVLSLLERLPPQDP